MRKHEKSINNYHEEPLPRKVEKKEDYDSYLLEQNFEPVTGDSPSKIYGEWLKRLRNVGSRLRSLVIQGKIEKPDILDEIDSFSLDEKIRLPPATPKSEDWDKGGRMIEINRADVSEKGSIPPEPKIYRRTFDRIDEEQYFILINKVSYLYEKAFGYLPEDVIDWHEIEEYKINAPNGMITIKNKKKE